MSNLKSLLTDPPEDDGLLFACKLDGTGGASILDWTVTNLWQQGVENLWLHLDRTAPRVQTWLRSESGLSEVTVDALLAEETRPRVFGGKKGIVAILRGLNTNTGADPEDMVAMRMWSDGSRVITLRQRKLQTPRDILAHLIETENGPQTPSQLFERLIARLNERMAATIASCDDRLDDIESKLDLAQAAKSRRELYELRQQTILLRRYISPQREALGNLLVQPPEWLEERCRMNLRETVDRLLRYIESLDAVRERSMVVKDDIANQLAESTNRTLYVLSIVSAIFLPLGFLTGLLGINVGGMPGVDNSNAFWIASGVMMLIVIVEFIIFRKLKWLS